MYLGEKLTAISARIYNAAREDMATSGVSPTLAVLIMENVLGKFRADAYMQINAERAEEDARAEAMAKAARGQAAAAEDEEGAE